MFPAFPAHAQPAMLPIRQEAHGEVHISKYSVLTNQCVETGRLQLIIITACMHNKLLNLQILYLMKHHSLHLVPPTETHKRSIVIAKHDVYIRTFKIKELREWHPIAPIEYGLGFAPIFQLTTMPVRVWFIWSISWRHQVFNNLHCNCMIVPVVKSNKGNQTKEQRQRILGPTHYKSNNAYTLCTI